MYRAVAIGAEVAVAAAAAVNQSTTSWGQHVHLIYIQQPPLPPIRKSKFMNKFMVARIVQMCS